MTNEKIIFFWYITSIIFVQVRKKKQKNATTKTPITVFVDVDRQYFQIFFFFFFLFSLNISGGYIFNYYIVLHNNIMFNDRDAFYNNGFGRIIIVIHASI